MNTKGNQEEEKKRGKDRKMRSMGNEKKGKYKLRGGMVRTRLLERVTVSEAEEEGEGRSRVSY